MKSEQDLPEDQKQGPASGHGCLKLPLVECAHESRPDEEMTPERVAEVLLTEEGTQAPGIPVDGEGDRPEGGL